MQHGLFPYSRPLQRLLRYHRLLPSLQVLLQCWVPTPSLQVLLQCWVLMPSLTVQLITVQAPVEE